MRWITSPPMRPSLRSLMIRVARCAEQGAGDGDGLSVTKDLRGRLPSVPEVTRRRRAYSPKCVEGGFSEVHLQDPE
jgi:hypothetical protein